MYSLSIIYIVPRVPRASEDMKKKQIIEISYISRLLMRFIIDRSIYGNITT